MWRNDGEDISVEYCMADDEDEKPQAEMPDSNSRQLLNGRLLFTCIQIIQPQKEIEKKIPK